MDPDTMFASRSVPRHLVRGVLGLAALVAGFALIPVWGPLTLLLALVGVVLLRGCPTCWALGLVQTRAVCRARAVEPTEAR
ncbi:MULTISPECIES: hypothetical protein [unclassified Nocardioides]|uniref:hypothetical protein n=1 Tax=unclassified Nocardioides TaxID=2615069 RepID=UPI003015875C